MPTSTYLMQPLRSLSAAKSMRKLDTQFALDDERRARRYIANKLAEVYAPKEFFGTPCIIRDISGDGCLFGISSGNVVDARSTAAQC